MLTPPLQHGETNSCLGMRLLGHENCPSVILPVKIVVPGPAQDVGLAKITLTDLQSSLATVGTFVYAAPEVRCLTVFYKVAAVLACSSWVNMSMVLAGSYPQCIARCNWAST